MTHPPNDELVREVEKRVLRELERIKRNAGETDVALVLEVRLSTELDEDQKARVQLRAERWAQAESWVRSVSLVFLPARGVAPGDIRVGPAPAAAATAPKRVPTGEVVSRLLVLSWHGRALRRQLAVGDHAVLLLRPDDDDLTLSEVRPRPVRLDPLTVLPRGRLLEVVRLPGGTGLGLRRTGIAQEVRIRLDSRELTPTIGPQPLREDGGVVEIAVDHRNGSEVVDYRYGTADEERPRSGLTVDHQTPMDLTVQAIRRITVRVEPPTLDSRLERRTFPIGEPCAVLKVDKLHSTGTTLGDVAGTYPQWFVKMFAALDPNSADGLRRYFTEQSKIVQKVNADTQVGDRRFVIAPIWVVPPARRSMIPYTDVGVPQAQPPIPAEHASSRLPDWFATEDEQDPDSYVVVVSPLLEDAAWTSFAAVPEYRRVEDLRLVAEALAALHADGTLHSDVKPPNVMRHDNQLVLVDGDAIVRIADITQESWRVDWYYSSSAVRRYKSGSLDTIEFREHDRFGFALVTLALVAGEDLMSLILEEDARGARPVDSRAEIAQHLVERWGDRWPGLIKVLTAPFVPGALQGLWHPVDWLDEIAAAGALDERGARPPVPDRDPPPPRNPFAAKVKACALADGCPPVPERSKRVEACLGRQLLARAERVEQQAFLRWWLIIMGVTAFLIVVSLILGQ